MLQKWIALLHVRPMSPAAPLSDGAVGAYGSVAGLANTEGEYRKLVEATLNADDLSVLEWENVQTEEAYRVQGLLSPYLEGLLAALSDQRPVQLHTFYNYRNDDA